MKTLSLAIVFALSAAAFTAAPSSAASWQACQVEKDRASRQDSGSDRDGFRQYIACLAR